MCRNPQSESHTVITRQYVVVERNERKRDGNRDCQLRLAPNPVNGAATLGGGMEIPLNEVPPADFDAMPCGTVVNVTIEVGP